MTDIRPTVDRYTTDSWPICHRHMTDIRSRCVFEISTDTRSIVYPTIDWVSTDCRLTIDRLTTDYRPTIDQQSTECRPTINRYIERVSTERRPLYRPIDRSTLLTHVQIFCGSLRPLECMPWILLFCIFGDYYASGIQDAEVNKVTAYFFVWTRDY